MFLMVMQKKEILEKQKENTQNQQSDKKRGIGVATDKHLIKHRLHDIAHCTKHAALDGHKQQRK